MTGDPKKKQPRYIPSPLRPRRLVWTLTLTALLAVVSAPVLFPMFQLWEARRDLSSGESERIAHGLTTLGEVALQHRFLVTGLTADVFTDLMADEKLSLGPVLRNLAQEVGHKNKKLVKAWQADLDHTADNDARFLALYRLITATGQWDENIPLGHRLRSAFLRVLYAPPNQQADALTVFLDFDPAAVRRDSYWPTLAKNWRQLADSAAPPDVRASALTLLTRMTGQVPPWLRDHPLPGEVEVAYEIGLLLLTGPLDEPALWREWLSMNLVTWTAILPPTTQAAATASQPATQPAAKDWREANATPAGTPEREKYATSRPAAARTQPAAVREPASFEETAWTVLRMAQSQLSAGADLPKPHSVLALPLLQRRAIAASLRYAGPNVLGHYADVLLNEDPDPLVRARVCLAFLYHPSPAARTPLLTIATRGVNDPNLSDEAWVAAHPERVAALAALAANREASQDDPALWEFLWALCHREYFGSGDQETEEAICTLHTLGTNPAAAATRRDFANLRILAFFNPAWQLKREAARTWLICSRVPATQPQGPGLPIADGGLKAASQSTSGPSGKDRRERLEAAATPQDAYRSLLQEMDYYEQEDGPPANAPPQRARLMAMFDAAQFGLFPAPLLGSMIRALSTSERGASALLAGLQREKSLTPALLQQQRLEPDPLVRMYLKIALGLVADPPDTAPLDDAYFSSDITRPLLYWADFTVGRRLPLDRLFMQQEFPRTLLQIDRFEEVVRTYFPSLPEVSLAADYELRKIGFSLQKRWWVVQVPRLHYEPAERRWVESK